MTKVWKDPTAKVTGRFFYVAFRDSKPTIDDLITIAHARMINFAIPRTRIDEARAAMSKNPDVMDPWVLLTTEARDLFMKTQKETGRSGELGEILLYMLMEWVLKAPIVASKMYLKTSQQMPVHGTDGIHLGYEGENLIMYWGESKMHETLPSALADISRSILEHIDTPAKRERELRIVSSSLNLSSLPDLAQAALKEYFNPYAPESNKLIDCYACLAGFDSELYKKVESLGPNECEVSFRQEYEKRIETACSLIVKRVEAAGLQNLRFSYFLLPFPSVNAARERFQKKLWGTA